MPEDKLLGFYNVLKESGAVEGLPADYATFKKGLSNSENAKGFYEAIKSGGVVEGLPDNFDSFSKSLGLGKPSLSVQRPAVDGGIGFGATLAGQYPSPMRANIPRQSTQRSVDTGSQLPSLSIPGEENLPKVLSPEAQFAEAAFSQMVPEAQPEEPMLGGNQQIIEGVSSPELVAEGYGLEPPLISEDYTAKQAFKKTIQEPLSVAKQKAKKEEDIGFFEGLYDALARGSMRLGQAIAETPAFIYDLAAIPQNYIVEQLGMPELKVSAAGVGQTLGVKNEVAKYYEEAIKKSQEKVEQKYTKGVTDYLFGDNPDYSKGFSLLAESVAESLPVTISLMIGNMAGASAIGTTVAGGLVFGAEKKAELDKEAPWMDEETKAFTALNSGLAEGVFSNFGLTKLGTLYRNLLKAKGKEEAERIAKEGFKKTYGKVLRDYFGMSAEEAISETATQFTQNLNDKYSGVKPNLDLKEGLGDAFLVGLASAKILGAPAAGIGLVQTKVAKNKQLKIEQDRNALIQEAESQDLPTDVKKVVSQKIKELNTQEGELVDSDKEKYESLTPEQKTQVDELTNKIASLEQSALDINTSPEVAKLVTAELNKLQEQVDAIYNSGNVNEAAQKFSEQQKAQRDAEVAQIEAIRPDLTDQDLLIMDLPISVDKTLDRMDANIPTDVVQIDEAISALDKKFDELEAYKKDPKRTHTSAQIDEVIDLLSEAKSELQAYKEKLSEYESATKTTEPTTQAEQRAIVEGEPKASVSKTAAKAEAEASELSKEALSITADDFATFEARGKDGRKARATLRERIGDEAYQRIEAFNKNFEKTIDSLEAQGKIKQRCK